MAIDKAEWQYDTASLRKAMAEIDEEAVEDGFWAGELENLIDDIES